MNRREILRGLLGSVAGPKKIAQVAASAAPVAANVAATAALSTTEKLALESAAAMIARRWGQGATAATTEIVTSKWGKLVKIIKNDGEAVYVESTGLLLGVHGYPVASLLKTEPETLLKWIDKDPDFGKYLKKDLLSCGLSYNKVVTDEQFAVIAKIFGSGAVESTKRKISYCPKGVPNFHINFNQTVEEFIAQQDNFVKVTEKYGKWAELRAEKRARYYEHFGRFEKEIDRLKFLAKRLAQISSWTPSYKKKMIKRSMREYESLWAIRRIVAEAMSEHGSCKIIGDGPFSNHRFEWSLRVLNRVDELLELAQEKLTVRDLSLFEEIVEARDLAIRTIKSGIKGLLK